MYKKIKLKNILFISNLLYSTISTMEIPEINPKGELIDISSFGSTYSKPHEEMSEDAMTAYFESSCRVDLHGRSEEEAKKFVISVIQQLQSMGEEKPFSCHFITGRGKHINRKGNRGTLFNNFPIWLEDKKIAHLVAEYRQTVGAYEVFLKPSEFKPDDRERKSLRLDTIQQWANLGEAQAQYLLGNMYAEGNKVRKDNKVAVEWLRKSAEQGFVNAQFKLGYMCAMGMGTRYNPQEALEWYSKAGKQGCSVALSNIGTMYVTGEGVPRDNKKAIEYYLEAAILNDLKAMNALGILYRLIGEDNEAVKWDRKAAESGQPHAKVNLGTMLLIGRGTERNEIEGVKWLREAAEYGIIEGQMRLGQAYEEGTGVQQNYVEALRWYLKAGLTDAGWPSAVAQWRLWYLYSEGKGAKANEGIANRWLVRAADNRHSIAQLELGRRYRYGTCGFERNAEKTLKYYKLSAKQGNPDAQYEIGELYQFGEANLEADQKKSRFWVKKAASNGHFFARLRLGYQDELFNLINEFEEGDFSEEF